MSLQNTLEYSWAATAIQRIETASLLRSTFCVLCLIPPTPSTTYWLYFIRWHIQSNFVKPHGSIKQIWTHQIHEASWGQVLKQQGESYASLLAASSYPFPVMNKDSIISYALWQCLLLLQFKHLNLKNTKAAYRPHKCGKSHLLFTGQLTWPWALLENMNPKV